MVFRPIAGQGFVLAIFEGVVDECDDAQFFAELRETGRYPVDIAQNLLNMKDNLPFRMAKTRFAPKQALLKFGLLQ